MLERLIFFFLCLNPQETCRAPKLLGFVSSPSGDELTLSRNMYHSCMYLHSTLPGPTLFCDRNLGHGCFPPRTFFQMEDSYTHIHWKQTNFLLKGFPGHSSSEAKEKDSSQMYRTCNLRGRCEFHKLSQVTSLLQIPGSSV